MQLNIPASSIATAAILLALGLAPVASASPLTLLATEAAGINNSGGAGGAGTHYHWGPGSEAQVNYSFGEEGRGVAEFDLSGVLSPVVSASVSFIVSGYQDAYYTPTPFEGNISLSGYSGNNMIELSDFESAILSAIGSFATSGLAVGDVLIFDVTALVNATLGGSLGLLWAPISASPEYSAITFGDITLAVNGVPEPGSLALLALGLAGLAGVRRHGARES